MSRAALAVHPDAGARVSYTATQYVTYAVRLLQWLAFFDGHVHTIFGPVYDRADYAIAYGKRTEEIVRCAGETGVDLIIMSSRKLDPDAPMQPWPTISHKVAVFAPCPVLLVR